MARLLRMPSVLANSTEAFLQAWLVHVGQSFEIGDDLAEVETEKALVELAAEDAGILGRQLVTDGNSVEVGMPIAVILDMGETDADIEALLAGSATTVEEPEDVPNNIGSDSPIVSEPTPELHRAFVSPLVRRLARDRGVDPSTLSGSGPGGRVIRKDLDAWLATAPASPDPARPLAATSTIAASASTYGFVDVVHTPMRRAIARRLSESKQTVPHFYMTTDCRVDRLLSLRREINESIETKISVNDMILKAAAVAFIRVPAANVIWTDDALRQFDQVDLAVAVSSDNGLVTPVVRNVGALTLTGVNRAVADLVTRARSARLRQEELDGGCSSISNLGMYGTAEFSAIINPPQSSILAVGAAVQRSVVNDGELQVASVMRCTLSVDHRAIDGALAAQWLAAFTAVIESPATMLI